LGICRISDGRYAEAHEALKQSLTLDSTSALTRYYLATTYRHLDQPQQAWAEARRAAELDSSLALTYLEMVHLAADAGDRAAAVEATREYLRRAPADSGMGYLRQFMGP
jgi:tetratricopeptide (TPR) repeat protein